MLRKDSWLENEIQYVKDNYSKMSYAEIGKVLGRTRTAVMVKCNRLGIRLPEKYTFDKKFFGKIDTEEKAYWLGFIYADGYIGNEYELGIQLANIDSTHLEKFNNSINGNFSIKHFIKNAFGKSYPMCSIRIYSKTIIDDLLNQGITNNKSLTISFPKIRKGLVRHFIRGYFDGDGSISIYEAKQHLRCKFTCGSKEFLLSLEKILNREGITTFFMNPKDRTYELGIPSKKSTKRFLEFLYSDITIYLDRKYNFYNTHKDLLEYIYDGWNNK